ncbi:MAG: HalD/BesD family halogenase [Hyphomicrobiaceae bacterium]
MGSSKTTPVGAETWVDLDRYPIADLTRPESAAFAEKCRADYVETGLCRLPGFIRREAIDHLAREANTLSGKAYFCKSTHNAYLTDEDDALDRDDVRNRQEETFVGSVAYDLIPDDAVLRRLYLWDPLRDFIGAVLGKPELHRFADPFGACSINVFRDGGEHGWHFDESEFTVTLMLQAPDEGGTFEYVPKVRGLPDEKKIVSRVLDGDRSGVVELPFTAGTLLIFGGNQTIHRVTRVHGDRLRLVPVLCYAEQPGLSNSPEVRELFWGRTG